MTQEDKQILFQDLCARLPYGVRGIITYDKSNIFTVEGIDNSVLHLSDAEECYVEDFKSYLRPMSSMTEQEKRDLEDKVFAGYSGGEIDEDGDYSIPDELDMSYIYLDICQLYCDWLNAHHFDYRGLIGRGLALKAPKGMYIL